MKILVTGSAGLIGSEVVQYFASRVHTVIGVDNNERALFFGSQGDTSHTTNRLLASFPKSYRHLAIDIKDREALRNLIKETQPNAIIHTAAQPSHDKAAQIPFLDFETNALGTLNLLEACREFVPESPIIHMSTNKVYGDKPNEIPMLELEKRFDYDGAQWQNGIDETLSIDQSKHSLFGASKVAADILVQEYGRYFGMPTVCLRGGCLTGPNHSGVELHGFLSYLIKCNVQEKPYIIFGYKGKQVRDNIHSFDVACLIDQIIHEPRVGEVYNLGGGKANTCSIIDAFELAEELSGKKMNYTYSETARQGDHICYYSDLSKLKSHYPNWEITKPLNVIFEEIHQSWSQKM